jgi:hypothetical protein
VIWTAWKNGKHSPTGTGYGFELSREDRDKHFSRDWQTVIVDLPYGDGSIKVEVSIANQSFWEGCSELRSKEIRQWLYRERHAPWPNRVPPKFQVVPIGKGRFRVKRPI